MDELPMKAEALAEMISLIEGGTISGKIGKELLPDLLAGKGEKGCTTAALRIPRSARKMRR